LRPEVKVCFGVYIQARGMSSLIFMNSVGARAFVYLSDQLIV